MRRPLKVNEYHQYLRSISADGRFVAFFSDSTNLDPNFLGNGDERVYIRDTCPFGAPVTCFLTQATLLVSEDSSGVPGDNNSGQFFSRRDVVISNNGRFVAFSSDATNLVPNDLNNARDIFLRDTCSANTLPGCNTSTIRVSVDILGNQARNWRAPSWFLAATTAERSTKFVRSTKILARIARNDSTAAGTAHARE